MRIACITSSWPTAGDVAAGAFVRDHTQLLRAAGHEVTVFCFRPGDYEEDVRVAAPLGGRSVFGAHGAPDVLDAAPWRALEAPLDVWAMVRAVLREPRFDLYLGHWLAPGGLVARLAGDRVGRPSAVVCHSAGVHLAARLPRPASTALRRYVARAGSTTVPSNALRAKLRRDVEVLPMGYHPLDVTSTGDGVLAFGRLVEIKGFDLALRVLHDAGEQLHVVGDGPERARLERLAPSATFWGWGDRAVKEQAFARCDRAVFPSRVLPSGRHEGWPVSVLEVSAAGIVPFVARWPGSGELVAQPQTQVVSHWRVPRDVAALREPTIDHAQRYSWRALAPAWVAWVERVAGG